MDLRSGRQDGGAEAEERNLFDSARPEPINVRIVNILRDRILTHDYDDTGMLPGEFSLAEEFKVSRQTIRVALQKLAADGLIERRRGSGTAVVQRGPAESTWSAGSLDMMIARHYDIDIESHGPVPAEDVPEIAEKFGLGRQAEVFSLVTLMRVGKTPLIHSTLYTRMSYARRVPEDQLGSGFFVNLVEEYAGKRAMRARQVTLPTIPARRIAVRLGMKAGVPALLLARSFFDANGELLHHILMHTRPDTFPQIINFYRRDDIRRRF